MPIRTEAGNSARTIRATSRASSSALQTSRPPGCTSRAAAARPGSGSQSGLCTARPWPTNTSSITRSKLARQRRRYWRAQPCTTSTPSASCPNRPRAAPSTSPVLSTATTRLCGAIARTSRAALPPPRPSTSTDRRRAGGSHAIGATSASQTDPVSGVPGRYDDAQVPSTRSDSTPRRFSTKTRSFLRSSRLIATCAAPTTPHTIRACRARLNSRRSPASISPTPPTRSSRAAAWPEWRCRCPSTSCSSTPSRPGALPRSSPDAACARASAAARSWAWSSSAPTAPAMRARCARSMPRSTRCRSSRESCSPCCARLRAKCCARSESRWRRHCPPARRRSSRAVSGSRRAAARPPRAAPCAARPRGRPAARIVSALAAGPRSRAALARQLGADARPALASLERDGLIAPCEVEQGPRAREASERVASLAPGVDLAAARAALARAPRQLDVLERVASGERLARTLPAAALRALTARGFARVHRRGAPRDVLGAPLEGASRVELTADQARALAPIESAIRRRAASTFLLHGVTGSGKTEVYLRAVAAALDVGRRALVLVPEITLTHQILARLRGRFGDALAVLHSGLRPGERLEQWQRLRSGAAPIAVGARSALFAPIENLGLVVIDEEHDGAYKNEEGFRYHARDLARLRARAAGCPVVLGSAPPALEPR